jgi:hypothetical protein
MMGNTPAVPFSEVTAQYPEEHRRSGTDDHEEHPGCNSSCEVRKEEDSNTGVHQNRQQNPCDAPCHVSTSCSRYSSRNDYIAVQLVSGCEAVTRFQTSARYGIGHPTLTKSSFAIFFNVLECCKVLQLGRSKDILGLSIAANWVIR